MEKKVGKPAKGAVVGVPVKPSFPKTRPLPVHKDNMPVDDFELVEELKKFAETVNTRLDEFVTIETSPPIKIQRRAVFLWASKMASDTLIGELYDIDQTTLSRHFKKELKLARALGRYRLQARLYDVAVSGQNASIMLFAAKNYLNMTDVGLTEPLSADTKTEAQDRLVKMTPEQVTALLRNATLTNTISIEKDLNDN